MKKILFLILLGSVQICYAETIALTCKYTSDGKVNTYNITIETPTATKKGKVYMSDKDQDSTSENGIGKISNMVVNGSLISWRMEYKSFPKTYSDPRYNLTAGEYTADYEISRTTGELRRFVTAYGGMHKAMGDEGTKLDFQQCEPRKVNKF